MWPGRLEKCCVALCWPAVRRATSWGDFVGRLRRSRQTTVLVSFVDHDVTDICRDSLGESESQSVHDEPDIVSVTTQNSPRTLVEQVT